MCQLNDYTRKGLALWLLKHKGILVDTDNLFTFASGVKSPLYCDMRKILASPAMMDTIARYFVDMDIMKYSNVIVGVASSGIPHATNLAMKTLTPLAYARSQAKGHGLQNRIEGANVKDRFCTIIEDVLSTGSSAFAAAKAVKEAGGLVLSIGAIYSHNFAALKENNPGFTIHTLITLDDVLTILEHNQAQVISKWREEQK